MDNLRKLQQWLNDPCDESEALVNPFGGGAYVPIDVVNKKIKFAEVMFNARFGFRSFSHSVYSLPSSVNISGSIEVKVDCFSDDNFDEDSYEVSVDELVGSATFDAAHYAPNTHWGATCKSLCISNALLKYPQFGGLLNSQRIDFSQVPVAGKDGAVKKIKADIVIEQKLKNAWSAGDEKTIEELNKIYDFTDAGTK